jgi:putative transcriptional regulator
MNSIKSLRARLGVTQEALAAGIGVTQGNVSNYERGQQVPPDVARRLITYAHGLGHGVTFDDIYGPLPELPRRRQADKSK